MNAGSAAAEEFDEHFEERFGEHVRSAQGGAHNLLPFGVEQLSEVSAREQDARRVDITLTPHGHYEAVLPVLGEILPRNQRVTIETPDSQPTVHIKASRTLRASDINDQELGRREIRRIVDVWNGDAEPQAER
ncbi:hypothetical protein ACQBAT_06665 [Ornithinimicrobium sp. Y1847]|uniref:hypothetical protein n=1 Tax=Ornithinimicrobium sp. Y1847 TaxID=3405419 RepID=UPI003B676FC2